MKGVNIDDPIMIDFVNQIDDINKLAEGSDGFIWRLKDDESNNATSLNPYEDEQMIVNLSVWSSVDKLRQFTYSSRHIDVVRRKTEWFKRFGRPHLVIWFVEKGIFPTAEEGIKRLAYLEKNGETSYAFTFKSSFKLP